MEHEGIDAKVYMTLMDTAVYDLKGLAINGDDLVSLGYSGVQIKVLLNQLLELVMREKIENNKEALIQALKKLH
jgi:tRNA nucleotidyltransferase (CCA-adding enzyme)